MNRRHLRSQSTNAGWLTTFADLSSLLLAFFVLTFSMYDIPPDGWISTDHVLPVPSSSLGSGQSGIDADPRRADQVHELAQSSDAYLMATLERLVADSRWESSATLVRSDHGIELVVEGIVLQSGDDNPTLAPGAEELVGEITAIARSTSRGLALLSLVPSASSAERALRTADPVLAFLHPRLPAARMIVGHRESPAIGFRLDRS